MLSLSIRIASDAWNNGACNCRSGSAAFTGHVSWPLRKKAGAFLLTVCVVCSSDLCFVAHLITSRSHNKSKGVAQHPHPFSFRKRNELRLAVLLLFCHLMARKGTHATKPISLRRRARKRVRQKKPWRA